MSDDRRINSWLTLVQVLLLAFKLNGAGAVAAWPWWAVLIPVWFWLGCVVIMLAVHISTAVSDRK